MGLWKGVVNDLFFLDTENIPIKRFSQMIRAKEITIDRHAILVLFFTCKINYDVIDISFIAGCFDEIIYESVDSKGKNALDFYLIAKLSLVAALEMKGKYFIISNDLGYGTGLTALREELSESTFDRIGTSQNTNQITGECVPYPVDLTKENKIFSKINKVLSKNKPKGLNKETYTKDLKYAIKTSKNISTFESKRLELNKKHGLRSNSYQSNWQNIYLEYEKSLN